MTDSASSCSWEFTGKAEGLMGVLAAGLATLNFPSRNVQSPSTDRPAHTTDGSLRNPRSVTRYSNWLFEYD